MLTSQLRERTSDEMVRNREESACRDSREKSRSCKEKGNFAGTTEPNSRNEIMETCCLDPPSRLKMPRFQEDVP